MPEQGEWAGAVSGGQHWFRVSARGCGRLGGSKGSPSSVWAGAPLEGLCGAMDSTELLLGAPRAPGRSQRLQSGSESLPTSMPSQEQFTEIKQQRDESREVGAGKSLLHAAEKLTPGVSLSARYVISLSAANQAVLGAQ